MFLLPFRAQLRADYPAYYETYREQLALFDSTAASGPPLADKTLSATRNSFGFEWTRFSEMRPEWEQNFWGYFSPFDASFFKNKLVLDAGCGMGRHLYYAARSGARVIGVDFSRAVDSAYQNTRSFPNAHVVQADLNQLPFRPETFDLIYSLGVLHHLPAPGPVLSSLLDYLRPGGETRIFVYWGGVDAPSWKRALLNTLTLVRKITTRLPHPFLNALCYPIAAAMWLTFVLPYHLLSKLNLTRALAEKLPMKQYAAYPFAVLVNDQFDRFSAPLEKRYSRAQVEHWLTGSGLTGVTVTPYYGWLGHGHKITSA